MTDKPTTPADPRDGEPYYIDSDCPNCGTTLQLYEPDSGWNDEWYCPECDDGIYMDWPEDVYDELQKRAQSEPKDSSG